MKELFSDPALSSSLSFVPCPLDGVRQWFHARGWEPFAFQIAAWEAYLVGKSGLIHVPTGAGKTYAAYGGPLAELIEQAKGGDLGPGLRVLYVTPLRAVARDIQLAMELPLRDLGILHSGKGAMNGKKVLVESRTGDTTASVRDRQKDRLPHVMVTTPESLTLLLTRRDCMELLKDVRCVILDEWHELLSSKRGTQTELALARLRRCAPAARTWALSATIENVQQAAEIAVGVHDVPVIVKSELSRPVVIESLLPSHVKDIPWAGHTGLAMLKPLSQWIDGDKSTLIFVNTRSQAERWFQALTFARPDLESVMALHHGSIERAQRERIEVGLKDGSLRVVVATSSLDLGVDFSPVERVVQIGSVKGVARLLQRAGRASHRPGETSHILCVPTFALNLLEIDAARRAAGDGKVEARVPTLCPLDVLTQHIVTIALGSGFTPNELFDEIRTTWSYRNLPREEFEWAMSMVREGGGTLRAYEQYHRIVMDELGVYRVPSARLAHLHKMNVGTITGDGTLELQLVRGKKLGNIEENFVAHLKPGDAFYFAGRQLEFVGMQDLTAFVKPSRQHSRLTPIWSGSRLPISESLSEAVRESLERLGHGIADSRELELALPLIQAQARLSKVPRTNQTLTELHRSREGDHLFVFPFDGRLVHAGMASIVALRLGRRCKGTFAIAQNDYGFELLSQHPYPFLDLLDRELFSPLNIVEDARAGVQLSSLARLQFREVARISGLVFQHHPGARKSSRQLQSSSGLMFDVFEEFDPDNPLLLQARREVLEKQFENTRLSRAMARICDQELLVAVTTQPTPMNLPLIAERIGNGRLSTETSLEQLVKSTSNWYV